MIGAHVERNDVLGGAAARGATAVQVFCSPPRSWAGPRRRGDEDQIRSSPLTVFVHASYLVNPASMNPEVRAKSRQSLEETCAAAAELGACGVVVHGGHPTGSGTVADGIANWLEVLDGFEPPVRILIENTAGGSAAVARRFDAFARLIDAVRSAGHDVGVCLDTCHAWAGGEDLVGVTERLAAFAGAVDLVHVNDSKDGFDSGRDRHEHLGAGQCDLDAIVAAVAEARCPAVVETPGSAADQAIDVELLRRRLR
jgi:deoxyribonuclease IV